MISCKPTPILTGIGIGYIGEERREEGTRETYVIFVLKSIEVYILSYYFKCYALPILIVINLKYLIIIQIPYT